MGSQSSGAATYEPKSLQSLALETVASHSDALHDIRGLGSEMTALLFVTILNKQSLTARLLKLFRDTTNVTTTDGDAVSNALARYLETLDLSAGTPCWDTLGCRPG